MLDTVEEEAKFVSDAKKLTADIVASGGAMADVAHLLNVYGVFVASSLASQVDIHTKKGFGKAQADTIPSSQESAPMIPR